MRRPSRSGRLAGLVRVVRPGLVLLVVAASGAARGDSPAPPAARPAGEAFGTPLSLALGGAARAVAVDETALLLNPAGLVGDRPLVATASLQAETAGWGRAGRVVAVASPGPFGVGLGYTRVSSGFGDWRDAAGGQAVDLAVAGRLAWAQLGVTGRWVDARLRGRSLELDAGLLLRPAAALAVALVSQQIPTSGERLQVIGVALRPPQVPGLTVSVDHVALAPHVSAGLQFATAAGFGLRAGAAAGRGVDSHVSAGAFHDSERGGVSFAIRRQLGREPGTYLALGIRVAID
jgi:hypothetical protein